MIKRYFRWHLYSKWPTVFKGNSNAPFSLATKQWCRGGHYSFSWITPLTLDPYFIMLTVKQGGIKYHFLSLRLDLGLNCSLPDHGLIEWNYFHPRKLLALLAGIRISWLYPLLGASTAPKNGYSRTDNQLYLTENQILELWIVCCTCFLPTCSFCAGLLVSVRSHLG